MIATEVAFWRPGAGHRERIRALVAYLSARTELSVAFMGEVRNDDRRRLLALGLPAMRLVYLSPKKSLKRRQYGPLFKTYMDENPCDVCIIEYVDLTFLINEIPKGVKIMLDTIDIISDRASSFQQYGAKHAAMTQEQEFKIYALYDAVILIQRSDHEKLRRILGEEKAILAPHPATLYRSEIRQTAFNIGFIASEYAPNVDAINWFVREVWPDVRRPGVTLNIYGNVVRRLSNAAMEGVALRGFVPSLVDVYSREIDVVINPVRFGAGLKIKNVEALGFGLPLVTTTHGATGMEDGAGRAFLVADKPVDYRDQLVGLLDSFSRRQALGEAAYRFAEKRFSPDACFAALLAEINRPNKTAPS